MRIMGIDPSFTATGWCVMDDAEATTGVLVKHPMDVWHGRAIARSVAKLAKDAWCDIVAIESPILNHIASPDTLMGMAGLAWLIRAELLDQVHYVDLRPQDRILWATGQGAARGLEGKQAVLAGARSLGFQGGDKAFDAADAFILADITRTAYAIAAEPNGAPMYNLLHVSRSVVLGRIVWPRIGDVKPEYPAREMPTKKTKRSTGANSKRSTGADSKRA